jgi:hypothetical protein
VEFTLKILNAEVEFTIKKTLNPEVEFTITIKHFKSRGGVHNKTLKIQSWNSQ